MNAKQIIQKLRLQAHPEGGFYRETYRSGQLIETRQNKSRNISTAIYFLLENENKSLFHRIQSDELWFFHQGEAIEIICIKDSQINTILLGNDMEKGEMPQARVPANTWFAAKIKNSAGYALVSCTVAPGFDFSDFELAKKETLLQQYSHLKSIIEIFT